MFAWVGVVAPSKDGSVSFSWCWDRTQGLTGAGQVSVLPMSYTPTSILIVLFSLVLLLFHINFKIKLSVSTKSYAGIWIGFVEKR